MRIKEIRTRVLKGDFSGLFAMGNTKNYVHPSDVAGLICSLPEQQALTAFVSLPEASQKLAFPYLPVKWQWAVVDGIARDRAAVILNALESDDRLAFFEDAPSRRATVYLSYLNEKKRSETLDLLKYPQDTVARFVNTDFVPLSEKITIGEAIAELRASQKDTDAANVVYVVDDQGRLLDDVPIRKLVLNAAELPLAAVLDKFCVSIRLDDSVENVIDTFKQYDRDVLPVVDENMRLVGVLTADDILDLAEREHTEDIEKFGGVEALDLPYRSTPFLTLIRKRAGWLIVLFVGEMLTATAMGYFDGEISKAVVLALFIPLIISSGGNSGSQAATLIIRSMALKELSIANWWYVMKRELLSGLTLGVILGAIGFCRVVLWQNLGWFDYTGHYLQVAATIFFSLIGIVMWGTLSGSMIPIVLKKAGFDPATSSAPFVATLVDVTGLVIYFSIAAIFLKGTLL